ncbi:MAG: hypothetical protein WAM69_08895 [Candidatus Sulfotelmatobacter sp.]
MSFCATRGCPRAGLVSTVLFALTIDFSLAACSGQKAPPPPDAATLLQAIPAADPAKYPAPQETRHWSNPYLAIRPDAVGLLTGIAADEEQMLKPEEVLNALAHLPASAWPYGRAVAILVDEKSTSSEQDKIALRRSRGIVAGELEDAHVAINWIPTS